MNNIVGQNILHFKILERLGEGGMGVVYKAVDTKLKREVAIKFLPHHISINEEERQRFEIEAQAAASLNHTNITTIHSVEEIDDPQRGKDVFIVMEYIEGVELKDKIKTGAIPTDEAINLAIQIAEGLEAAHKKGIVHRDIKSGNIMITSDGKVKIMDFGLAKIGEGVQLTKAGTTIGTAAYMSPEQARGEDVDYRTDIWSFGVVFYEMLTEKLPFKGSYDQAIIYAILNQKPESVQNISTELNLIIKKTLAKEPENRYQSVGELLNDLKHIKENSLTKRSIKREKLFIKKNRNRIMPAGIAIIIFLLAAIYIYYENIPEKIEPLHESKLIVVLPFENLGVAEDEYFADGITEEISARLSLIKGLGVVSHTSAMYYKNTSKTIPEISKDLNVDYVLNGSVRWEKSSETNKIKIIPRLTQVSDNIQIWAESYERQLDEIFSLQGDIAAQIANALNITLNQSEKKEIESELTKNFDAYQSYLQGTDAWFIFNTSAESFENIERAIKLFERSVELDPQFSQAWARLSITYTALYWFGYVKTSDQLALAKEAADKAIKLNAESTESLTSMGYYFYWGLLDYDKALTFMKKALSINPNDTKLIMTNALILRRKGDFKKAAELMEKALLLDPRVVHNYDELGVTYKLMREYDKADKSFNRSIKIAPDNFNAYAELAQNYWLCCGDLKRAREIINSIPAKTFELNIHMLFEINILNRSYRDGLRFINYMNREVFEELRFWTPSPLLRGRLYQLIGTTDSANIEYIKAKTILENKIKETPADYRVRMSLGLTYAGLGLYKQAVEEGKKAEELYPLSKDAIIGNIPILTLAYIYTMAGNYDEALDKIDELLSRPFEFSVALLKIDPRFDVLRSHPKYQKILKKYSE